MDETATLTHNSPRGIYATRCDHGGWVRLPPICGEYLNNFGGPKVFVTSIEEGILRIYPLPVWRRNEILCDELDPHLAGKVLLCAYAWGADAVVDGRGWIRLPSTLREKLKLDGQPVWVDRFRGRLNVSTEPAYRQRLLMARQNLQTDLEVLERLGLH